LAWHASWVRVHVAITAWLWPSLACPTARPTRSSSPPPLSLSSTAPLRASPPTRCVIPWPADQVRTAQMRVPSRSLCMPHERVSPCSRQLSPAGHTGPRRHAQLTMSSHRPVSPPYPPCPSRTGASSPHPPPTGHRGTGSTVHPFLRACPRRLHTPPWAARGFRQAEGARQLARAG